MLQYSFLVVMSHQYSRDSVHYRNMDAICDKVEHRIASNGPLRFYLLWEDPFSFPEDRVPVGDNKNP